MRSWQVYNPLRRDNFWLILFGAFYVMQGIPAGFRANTLYNFLNESHHSAQTLGAFVFWTSLPWSFQFLWGPSVDRFLRSWPGGPRVFIFSTQIIAALMSSCLLLVKDPGANLGLLIAIFFLHSTAAALQDTAVDAYSIQVVDPAQRGMLNACMRIGFLLGVAIGAAFLSHILRDFGFRSAVLYQTFFLLALSGITFIGSRLVLTQNFEAETHAESKSGSLRSAVRTFFHFRTLQCFFAIWMCSVSVSVFSSAFSYGLVRVHGWTALELSHFQGTWATLAAIAALFLGGKVSDRIGAEVFQRVLCVALCVFVGTLSHFSVQWSSLLATTGIYGTSLMDPLFCVGALPLVMLLARKRNTATLFTAFMALLNLGDLAAAGINAYSLPRFSVIEIGYGCSLVFLASALLMPRLSFRLKG